MTCPLPYLVTKNPDANHSVYLLLTNNNHFETLISKDTSSTLLIQKLRKRITKRKKKLKSKARKNNKYMRENKIYAEKTLKAIKYLLNGAYPIEVISLESVELRKQWKRGLKRSSKGSKV